MVDPISAQLLGGSTRPCCDFCTTLLSSEILHHVYRLECDIKRHHFSGEAGCRRGVGRFGNAALRRYGRRTHTDRGPPLRLVQDIKIQIAGKDELSPKTGLAALKRRQLP